jgi:uncharacterized protein (DUF1778 family)
MTGRDPVTRMTDAELAKLADEVYEQRNDESAWEDEDRPTISSDVRSVVSVRFNKGELEPIERAAAAAGVPVSTYIRNAAINAVSTVDLEEARRTVLGIQADLESLVAALGASKPTTRRRRAVPGSKNASV